MPGLHRNSVRRSRFRDAVGVVHETASTWGVTNWGALCGDDVQPRYEDRYSRTRLIDEDPTCLSCIVLTEKA